MLLHAGGGRPTRMRIVLLAVGLALVTAALPAQGRDLPVEACTQTAVLRGECDGFACVASDLAPWAGACVAPIDCRKLELCQPCTCPPIQAALDPRLTLP